MLGVLLLLLLLLWLMSLIIRQASWREACLGADVCVVVASFFILLRLQERMSCMPRSNEGCP